MFGPDRDVTTNMLVEDAFQFMDSRTENRDPTKELRSSALRKSQVGWEGSYHERGGWGRPLTGPPIHTSKAPRFPY